MKPSLIKRIGWRIEAIIYDLYVGFIRSLPIDMASDLGAGLWGIIGPLLPTHKTVLCNLRMAFPELDDRKIKAIALAQWKQTGRTSAELPIMDRIKAEPDRYVVKGQDILDAYRVSNKPFVVVAVHQGNWELVPIVVLNSNIPFLVTYRAANNPHVDERIRKARQQYGVSLFGPKGSDGAKELLKALENGVSVGLMNDQKFNRGIVTPFFGYDVETAPGPTRLAQRFDTDLVPMSVKRLNRANFEVTIHQPIKVANTGHKSVDIETTVKDVTRWVEAVVRADPKGWFWVHKRWPNSFYKEKRHKS